MTEVKIFNHPRPKKSVLPPPPKKRKTEHKIEEINFDFDKREDYLTGFHKRKVARTKQAQAEAVKKAKEERTELRKTVSYILLIPLYFIAQERDGSLGGIRKMLTMTVVEGRAEERAGTTRRCCECAGGEQECI